MLPQKPGCRKSQGAHRALGQYLLATDLGAHSGIFTIGFDTYSGVRVIPDQNSPTNSPDGRIFLAHSWVFRGKFLTFPRYLFRLRWV
ncbi:hypothetical protein HW44_15640 [Nitrosococcus oceani]|nr:hypothetical protein HW44_15640 [Nitrosococcus oceani]